MPQPGQFLWGRLVLAAGGPGLFDDPVPVPAGADEQTRLIAFTGRKPA
jgi:hypothetical protein